MGVTTTCGADLGRGVTGRTSSLPNTTGSKTAGEGVASSGSLQTTDQRIPGITMTEAGRTGGTGGRGKVTLWGGIRRGGGSSAKMMTSHRIPVM